jgi:hypothetical protein
MDNKELTQVFSQHQTYNGEDCLIIPLRNIIRGEITAGANEYPRITLEYWGKS